jgi:ribosomal protein S18 acetylase RimI-like enzyme
MTHVAKFKPGESYVGRLRDSMFSDMGCANDVLKQVQAFAKFDRSGLDLVFDFETGKTVSAKTRRFVFNLCKKNMEETLDENGFGWDDEDREDEIKDECVRYLMVRQKKEGGGGKLVGYADFRFTLQGDMAEAFEGFPILHVTDLQLVPEVQRKGLGRHMLMTLEMIARKQKMTYLTMRVFKGNTAGEAFVTEKLKGFAPDNTWVSKSEPFQFMQKLLAPGDLQAEGIKQPESPMAVSPPGRPKDETTAAPVPKARTCP